MDGNQFEQFVAQMVSGLQQSTDWMYRNQQAEIDAHDAKLAAAEQVLRSALDFIVIERQRLRPQKSTEGLRQLHEQLNKPLPKQPTPEQGQLPGKQNSRQPF